jgi:TonB family protein
MRFLLGLVLFCGVALPCLGQAAGDAPGLPKEPREVFAAAAPFYDFNDPAMKPWHLKASYQTYDGDGKPAEQGTYEYWWAAPKVYRSTWTRPSATHTDWHTADGKHEYLVSGEPLKFFEFKLKAALLSPLPEADDLDPGKFRLDREMLSDSSTKYPCIMVIPLMPQHGQVQTVPLGLFPTYCFDPKIAVLRTSTSFGTVTTEFNKIVKVWGKYLPRELLLFEGGKKILSAAVDSITNLNSTDPAFTPSSDAEVAKINHVQVSGGVAQGLLLKKQQPVYPQDAKNARASGTVVLRATIGLDGGVHDLHVVSTPWPSLAASALWAVSHWEYRPYVLNDQPVEVETTINVIYTLGY